MGRIVAGIVAGAAALAAVPLAAQTLADGAYTCTIGSFVLGDIDIRSGSFSGPAYDGAFGEYYPFQVTNGTIAWGGPLGGISAAGTIVSSVLKDAGGGQVGFDVMIRNPEGNFQQVSCSPAW